MSSKSTTKPSASNPVPDSPTGALPTGLWGELVTGRPEGGPGPSRRGVEGQAPVVSGHVGGGGVGGGDRHRDRPADLSVRSGRPASAR